MTPTTLLAFESQWPTDGPTKREAIRRELGISEVRYYVLLRRAACSLEGIKAYPMAARRVRERAETLAAQRTARRTAPWQP